MAMRYWWVNQNQTFRHEVGGGYLWSPKVKANGQQNAFYDFMREVAPGDIIFSFADARIRALGVARSHAYEAPKPLEFGQAGAYWDKIGWRVDVAFIPLRAPHVRPAEHMTVLARHLPHRYAPLRPNGMGLQSVYLTRLSVEFASALIDLIGVEARDIVRGRTTGEPLIAPAIGLAEWEEHQVDEVRDARNVPETERQAIILARRGQGLFKQNVMRLERACRITGVDRPEHLRASHCKPWRDSNNEERLDGQNGLLLTPNADHLFDRGFIGFEGNGDLLISPVAHTESLRRLGLESDRTRNVGVFSEGQRRYLEYHRTSVLLRSRFIEE
jgi:putative restriction endonuclease